MPPDPQLPGTVQIIYCLDDGLGSQLTLSSPPLAAVRPHKRGLCQESGYLCSICARLIEEHPEEVQAQSTAEACQQKWYYNQKVGAVNLKPGDLVLVKADAWKGKRKIKDRWDEETWEVSQQIVTDVPSYKVTNQHRQSQVLHQNWLLLVASEVGIPLCMGNCHTQYRCTSPTPRKTTSSGGDKMLMPREQNGKVFTQRPTRKASQGWKNGKLQLG